MCWTTPSLTRGKRINQIHQSHDSPCWLLAVCGRKLVVVSASLSARLLSRPRGYLTESKGLSHFVPWKRFSTGNLSQPIVLRDCQSCGRSTFTTRVSSVYLPCATDRANPLRRAAR